MRKRNVLLLVGLLLAAGLYFGGRSVYYEYYPVPKEASASWEPYVSALAAERESFFVEVDGIELEADFFIPSGGAEQKPAIVFSPGSGDALYQNYAPGFIETFILDTFLGHDIAVLLVNKRGMGRSEGLHTDLSIEGRAEDVLASARAIQTHPRVDGARIGLVGHSEGGWTVTHAAAQNPDIAFFISLAGPTVNRWEQAMDMYTYEAICSHLEGDAIDRYVEKRANTTQLGTKIGGLTNFGSLGFDYRSYGFDPRDSLRSVRSPGLFVYGENDILVLPDRNVERMTEIFDGDVPDNITIAVVADASHDFRVVGDPCDSWNDPELYEISTQVKSTLDNWLAALGYATPGHAP